VIDDAERLDAAFDSRTTGPGMEQLSPAMRALVDLAVEIAAAYSHWGLEPADRERIYAASLRLAASGTDGHLWARLARSRGLVIGGTAAVAAMAAAAIGVGVLIERRGHHLARAT
jgi:hypothetical protein